MAVAAEPLVLSSGVHAVTRFGAEVDLAPSLMEQRVLWAVELFSRMGWVAQRNNLTAEVAWETAEGGGFGNIAANNPTNTTQYEPGCWVVNSVGVKAYPTAALGMQATVTTLLYPAYDSIRADMADNAAPDVIAAAIGASPWGTPGGLIAECVPESAAAIDKYWTPPPTPSEDAMFIREPNGTVWQFVASGTGSYWREWPAAAAANLPSGWVMDDKNGVALKLWRCVPVS